MKRLAAWLLLVVVLIEVDSMEGVSKNHDGKDFVYKDRRTGREIIINNVADLSVFYNLKTNHTIKDMLPRPWIKPGQSLKLPFNGGPCSCVGLGCGCCAGIKITQINFDQTVCANISYDSFLFGIVLDVNLNGRSVFHTIYSAKNPPRICIPIPLGPIPGVDFCIRLYDIFTPGVRNIHVCMDWEFRIIANPVLVLHFDCLKMGADGIIIVKPGSVGPTNLSSEPGQVTDEEDIIDEVFESDNTTDTKKPDVKLKVETIIVTEDNSIDDTTLKSTKPDSN